VFGALAYSASAAGVNATNTDFVAASDPDFSARNNHYIFSEDYLLKAIYSLGASLTRGRIQVPSWNAMGEFNLWAANRGASPVSNGSYDNFYTDRMVLPQNEEFQVQWSNNLGASTEQEQSLLLIAPTDWTANLPPGGMPIRARASFTVTPTVNAWSGPQAITLSSNLRGGSYAVTGARLQGANSAFFRLIFPRSRMAYGTRKMRPGNVVQTAIGDVPPDRWLQDTDWLGEWGRFHTFELPQCEVFGITAGSITYQLFLDLIYLGATEGSLGI
jgi:hypothetical protein